MCIFQRLCACINVYVCVSFVFIYKPMYNICSDVCMYTFVIYFCLFMLACFRTLGADFFRIGLSGGHAVRGYPHLRDHRLPTCSGSAALLCVKPDLRCPGMEEAYHF